MANQGGDASHEPQCRYDVFLSFRGPDTRHTFTGYLYNALKRKGFNTFMDDEGLKSGDQISLSLVNAIEESRISIIVFSENYASSSWCLDELVKILECMKLKNQLVCPIFYKVDPSDVRHQRNSYGKAMAAHENRFRNDFEKVRKWRSTLSEVANLKGWHFETGYEYEFINMIVEIATAKLHRQQLHVDQHVIGHGSRIEEVKSLLDINTVCMVGIHGAGGMGKTTLAKALYNLIVDQFECAIFLEGVRERSDSYMGLVHLQEAILSKLKLFKGENIKLGSVDEGATLLKDRLCHRRVLLVLDDVDNEYQLKKLAGESNWFRSGSMIIITTRDKHLLIVHRVEKRYEMKELNDHEALQLFCWNAFKMSHPATTYEDVSNRAVRYASGLPLALKVMGSNLVGKSVKEYECALEQYKRIPERKIQDILKISYDNLEENSKHIFLDIACFFIREALEYVEKVECDFFPAYNIGILVDKSLLTIENGHLKMHDLIRDMGKEIVRQDEPSKPGERSRLWFHKDVLRVLTENSGSSNIEGIILDPPEQEEVEWSGTAFEKMNNLRILIVRNAHFSSGPNYLPNSLRLLHWKGYPSESLPTGFCPRNVVVLSLPQSHLRLEKEKPLPNFEHLTYINFGGCQYITHVPDVSGVPNLRELTVDHCMNLVAVHHSVGFLKKLLVLSTRKCTSLRTFLPRMWLPSLKILYLHSTRIKHFPDIVGVMDKPLSISLIMTPIKELPQSIGNLTGLEHMEIYCCGSLRDVPSNFFMLPKIDRIRIYDSPEVRESFRRFRNSQVGATSLPNLRILSFKNSGLTDEDLHAILSCFPNLEELEVPDNNFVSLPARIKESANLRVLDVSDCKDLQEIPELPSSIQKVVAGRCPYLTSETTGMLWSQGCKEVSELEVSKLEVIMPQTQIPDWFDHRCEGGILSFWACRKFPVIALAFIFNFNNRRQPKKFPLCDFTKEIGDSLYAQKNVDGSYINGGVPLHFMSDCSYSEIAGNHVLLIRDVRSLFKAEEWPILDTFVLSDWKYVKLECPVPDHLTVGCGAHVYKQLTNMEDIHFKCPNPLKRTTSIGPNPPNKRLRKPKPKCGGKDNRKARRRSAKYQTLSSGGRIKKIVFPMNKCFWRFLSQGLS